MLVFLFSSRLSFPVHVFKNAEHILFRNVLFVQNGMSVCYTLFCPNKKQKQLEVVWVGEGELEVLEPEGSHHSRSFVLHLKYHWAC